MLALRLPWKISWACTIKVEGISFIKGAWHKGNKLLREGAAVQCMREDGAAQGKRKNKCCDDCDRLHFI